MRNLKKYPQNNNVVTIYLPTDPSRSLTASAKRPA